MTRKLEEMENRVLVWDPDEHTEDFGQKLMRKRDGEVKYFNFQLVSMSS